MDVVVSVVGVCSRVCSRSKSVFVGPGLHPSPLEKIEWVSNLCPIFVFPSVEGISVGHLRTRTPLIVFFPISLVMDKVLYSSPTSSCIHNFFNEPFLSAIFSDNRLWSGKFTVGEEERVVWNISLQ